MTRTNIIYCRQSLDRQGEGAAIERQAKLCREYADSRGWVIDEVIADNDMSGSTGKPRPGYRRLLGQIAAGAVERVVCFHIDRLTRRLVDLEELVELCEATDCKIASVSGDLDLSTDVGQLIARILGSVAMGEVKRKSARQRAANRQRAEGGEMGWSARRPFGYERNAKGRIVLVRREARALKTAAKNVLADGSLSAEVRRIQAAGITTTAGGPMNVTTLRRCLLNRRYSGDVHYRGERTAEGAWPKILTVDQQDQLAAVLRDKSRLKHLGTDRRYLLSGIAVCGKCGKKVLFATRTAKGQLVYRCSPSGHLQRALEPVDELVEAVILGRLAMPDVASLLADPGEDVDALRRESAELQQRRDAIGNMVADGLLGGPAARTQAQKLTASITEVEARISASIGESPVVELVGAEDVRATWDRLPVVTKKRVVRLLIEEVRIQPQGKGRSFDPCAVEIRLRAF